MTSPGRTTATTPSMKERHSRQKIKESMRKLKRKHKSHEGHFHPHLVQVLKSLIATQQKQDTASYVNLLVLQNGFLKPIMLRIARSTISIRTLLKRDPMEPVQHSPSRRKRCMLRPRKSRTTSKHAIKRLKVQKSEKKKKKIYESSSDSSWDQSLDSSSQEE